MTKGEQTVKERQGEDVCVCRDDREKDRYGESVTFPIWVRRRRQRQIMRTERGTSDKHTACKCIIQKRTLLDSEWDVCESLYEGFIKK